MAALGLQGVLIAVGLLLLGMLAGWAVGLYNSLVQLRVQCEKAFSNIDVLLVQRHDEVRQLVDVCRGAMAHESSVLEKLTEIRSRYEAATDASRKVAAENAMRAALPAFWARVEAYPDLKSGANLLELQRRITGLETQVAQRRELYNDSVTLYNIFIMQLPQAILVGLLGLPAWPLLEFSDEEKRKAALGLTPGPR